MTPVNLQFADRADFQEFEGFDTLAVLRQDSNTVTGQPGARKPVVSELFTCMAEAAVERGARYFGFTNSDILFTPAAIERLQHGDRTAYVFARTDFESGTEHRHSLADLRHRCLRRGGGVVAVVPPKVSAVYRRRKLLGQRLYRAVTLLGGRLAAQPGAARTTRGSPRRVAAKPVCETQRLPGGARPDVLHPLGIYADRLAQLRTATDGLAAKRRNCRLQDEVFRDWKPTIADHVAASDAGGQAQDASLAAARLRAA